MTRDFLASVTVFLIALPLCLGIAIASGAPVEYGLLSGIIGGIVVGSIAGAPLQVSGPAASLAVLVYFIIEHHGLGALGWITLIAGAIQLVSGILRLGPWFRAVSPAVINGMLAGIGVLIAVSQCYVLLDLKPEGTGFLNLIGLPGLLVTAFEPGSPHLRPALLGASTIVVIALWNRVLPKKYRVLPGALVGVVFATVVAGLSDLSVAYIDVPDQVFNRKWSPLFRITFKEFQWAWLQDAVVMAFIASAATLMTATAIDRMQHKVRTNYNKELFSQGVGNMLAGLVGALPITGVIVRSSANVQAGAVSRKSTILHGIWLLGLVGLVPFALRLIPMTGLAAVLVYTGYKLVDINAIKRLRDIHLGELVVYAATLCGVVLVDLFSGIAFGVVLSLLRLGYSLSYLEIDITNTPERIDVYLHGAATFLTIPRIAGALESLPDTGELHVHFEELSYVDHACLEMLAGITKRRSAAGGDTYVDMDKLEMRVKDSLRSIPPPPKQTNGFESPRASNRDQNDGHDVASSI